MHNEHDLKFLLLLLFSFLCMCMFLCSHVCGYMCVCVEGVWTCVCICMEITGWRQVYSSIVSFTITECLVHLKIPIFFFKKRAYSLFFLEGFQNTLRQKLVYSPVAPSESPVSALQEDFQILVEFGSGCWRKESTSPWKELPMVPEDLVKSI